MAEALPPPLRLRPTNVFGGFRGDKRGLVTLPFALTLAGAASRRLQRRRGDMIRRMA